MRLLGTELSLPGSLFLTTGLNFGQSRFALLGNSHAGSVFRRASPSSCNDGEYSINFPHLSRGSQTFSRAWRSLSSSSWASFNLDTLGEFAVAFSNQVFM